MGIPTPSLMYRYRLLVGLATLEGFPKRISVLLWELGAMGNGQWGTRGPLWGLGAMGSGEWEVGKNLAR
jgi:hypothetical protein